MQSLNLAVFLVLVTFLSASVRSLEILRAEGEHACGSILNEANGILQYKPFEQAQPNERCVWILRVPYASGYNFTLYNLGYGGTFDDNALHITGLNRGDHYTKELVPSRTDSNYFINGSVAILTYYSSTYRVGRGFALFWTAHIQQNSTTDSLNSATEIVSTLQSNISHPRDTSGLTYYDDNELSVFLYTPEFSNNKTLHANQIRFVQLGMEGTTCNDFIDIFIFNPQYAREGWDTYGRFCGPDSDVTFSGSDMVLLVFHSDASQTNSGFELIYERRDVLIGN